ncbi:FtsX-like permease family protein [Natrinema sp. 1APR25-10V2]|uniref:FtsX-like permease family protein n=1 Tax=Natrinema sp. 1APR25-10V2 TaxID=2951081 RepID=UPI0028768100|nr:FtsX-like permease family protein [Natrinema sp. 1APR25-10V2]MDS0475671.1 ABC transporter permease [Natrinema sp. 1APR25-10V2]
MRLRQRLTRWLGFIAVGIRRTASRATATAQQRVRFSCGGVAVAIALLVMVTGLGVGLATSTTVADEEIDYWVVPDTDSPSSPLVATDDPQFGAVHETNARITELDGVDAATPVLAQVLPVEANDSTEYVLVVGVISSPELGQVTGLETAALTPHDPYYAAGAYNGTWTGEVVLSDGAADLFGVTADESVTIAGNSSFTVTRIETHSTTGGTVPTALVQLSELQRVTGAAQYDQADQFVVSTATPAVKDDIAGLYPQSTVQSRGAMTVSSTRDSALSLALALTAVVVALTIGTLFVVTTSGLELVVDRQQLALLSAMGISVRSQLCLVGTQTLVLTGLGGVLGSVGGLVGIRLINTVAMRTLTTEPIAVSHLWFIPYGTGVGLVIGLLSLPLLLVITRRMTGGVPT